MQVDALDRVIKNAIDVMESSKYQIFEICESVRSERQALNSELQQVMEETTNTINKVDRFEMEYRRARVRLTEVSRDFKRFKEDDIRAAYELATQMQTQLAMLREKELHLKARRDDLQKRIKNVDKQLERAESVVSQVNVVLEYLDGDLDQVTRLLESAKNRQLIGLKIILAQEEERKRIAREIHDGLAQTLANVVLRTEIVERMLNRDTISSAKEELVDLKIQVRSGIEEVRKIIFNLRPMALDDLGLVPALRKFIQDYEEKTKIRTKIELAGKEARLPSGMEVAIFRVVQEAFSNVLKHSQASHVTLELTYQQQMVKVTVKDNGIGFVVEQIDKKIDKGSHYGLMGMRERVELLEGRMEVESDVGAGAKVSMLIPIKLESKEG
ncbi:MULTISPECIES: sensor histidine kinase [Paenibacillus]|jgi:two-component system sensor histidine kinase DegS|uniref:Signal transduction histidine-protein kinase/phosphatase DegS n=1 Tax=Paenibacillus baimaensis TaxID=2982185 RepID=A0ABT2UH11_9BACL|nr:MULTISPECIES: sensor histidine kinase [Paenibacillus]MCU6792954.1 sensor histidine kinase [Paenibacillus sp. WQ 127069]OMF13116.1 histidine kinase [Paenibacillus sp. FSL H7-0331]